MRFLNHEHRRTVPRPRVSNCDYQLLCCRVAVAGAAAGELDDDVLSQVSSVTSSWEHDIGGVLR